jgi:DNA-directed RNA polymerase subunit M/transcription elongation factor TFIIS
MSLRKIEKPEVFRNNIVLQLNEKIGNIKHTTNLEKGLFNYTLNESKRQKVVKKWDNPYFVQIYLNRLKTIMSNLTETIIQDINNKTIKPHMIAFMTHQEFMPEKWETLVKAKSIRDMNKFENNMAAATDTFTCKKCKGTQCTYYTAQIRSADEPCTIFVTCCTCGCRWKTC